MLFHTLDFAVFFGAVVLLYALLRGPWLLMALTAASYFFYGYIQPYYMLLLFLLTLSDYVIGLVAGLVGVAWTPQGAPLVVFLLLILALLFRPNGLFGRLGAS